MATQHIPIPTQLVAPRAVAAPPVASASFELDAEPTPAPDTVDAALLEYMPDSAPSAPEPSQQTAADSSPSKEYAWQPRSKPMAEPMASALRRAAEAAGKTEFDNPAASHASATHSGSGAAAAPARAREPKVTPLESKSVAIPQQATPQQATPQQVHLAPATETKQLPSAAEIWEAHSPAQAQTPAPRFSSLDAPKDFRGEDASNNGGSKKILLIAVVLLAVAAGYFGWSKMQTGQSQSASHSIAPAETGLASLPPAPAPSAPEVQPSTGQVASQSPEQAASAPGTLASSKPSAGVAAEAPGLKAPAAVTAKAAGTDSAVTTVKPPAASPTESAPALVVNNGVSNQPKTEAAPEPEEAPAPTSIATGADNSALSGLVNTNAINAQKAPQQTLRISQGVSQGLILKKVQPVYPAQALQMRVEGAVELQANISKTGAITGLKQLSGQNILGRAAMDAVKQWKYKPYFLNGEPVEVQTQITVNFKLP
jgi:protein TonB